MSRARITLKWVTCLLPRRYGNVMITMPRDEVYSKSISEWESILLQKANNKNTNVLAKTIRITFLEESPMSIHSPNYKEDKYG